MPTLATQAKRLNKNLGKGSEAWLRLLTSSGRIIDVQLTSPGFRRLTIGHPEPYALIKSPSWA